MNEFLRLLLVVFSIALISCSSNKLATDGNYTTVVLVRHGERTMTTKELNKKGRARAEALPEAVADLDIVAIYAPDLPRNLGTAKPLSDKLAVPITVFPAEPIPTKVARRLRSAHPGKTVIWIGNAPNLRFLHPALAGINRGSPPVAYGAMSIIQIPMAGGEAVVTRRRFGK